MGLVSRYRNHNELVLQLLKKVYQRIKSDYSDLDSYELKQIEIMIKRLEMRNQLLESHKIHI